MSTLGLLQAGGRLSAIRTGSGKREISTAEEGMGLIFKASCRAGQALQDAGLLSRLSVFVVELFLFPSVGPGRQRAVGRLQRRVLNFKGG